MPTRQPPKVKRPPRLHHKKSRTGCARCRLRRVKCDETHPICNNCMRHNVSCEYDRLPDAQPAAASSQTRTAGESPSGVSPTASLSTASGANEPADDDAVFPSLGRLRSVYWELKALHNFTVATSRTVPGTHVPGVLECWSVDVPRMALGYAPLLHELLALSALHLLSTGCHDPDLLACRATYLGAALREHRQVLTQLAAPTASVADADAACFTSGILPLDGFASLRDRPLRPYEPPVGWLRIVRGARAVFEHSRAVFLARPHEPSLFRTHIISTADFANPRHLVSDAHVRRFAHLLPTDYDLEGLLTMDPDDLDAYRRAVSFLGYMHAAVEAGEHVLATCRKLISFGCLVPSRFLDLVEQKEPRALVIFAHFLAFGARAQDLWWIGDTPHREVHAIRDYVPLEWVGLLSWPLCVLADA